MKPWRKFELQQFLYRNAILLCLCLVSMSQHFLCILPIVAMTSLPRPQTGWVSSELLWQSLLYSLFIPHIIFDLFLCCLPLLIPWYDYTHVSIGLCLVLTHNQCSVTIWWMNEWSINQQWIALSLTPLIPHTRLPKKCFWILSTSHFLHCSYSYPSNYHLSLRLLC